MFKFRRFLNCSPIFLLLFLLPISYIISTQNNKRSGFVVSSNKILHLPPINLQARHPSSQPSDDSTPRSSVGSNKSNREQQVKDAIDNVLKRKQEKKKRKQEIQNKNSSLQELTTVHKDNLDKIWEIEQQLSEAKISFDALKPQKPYPKRNVAPELENLGLLEDDPTTRITTQITTRMNKVISDIKDKETELANLSESTAFLQSQIKTLSGDLVNLTNKQNQLAKEKKQRKAERLRIKNSQDQKQQPINLNVSTPSRP